MTHERPPRPGLRRRCAVLSTVLCVLVSGLAAAPAPAVRADEGPPPGSRAAEYWEDMLLLQVLQYLEVTPEQVPALQALAGVARERGARVREQTGRTEASLERLLQKLRKTLLEGRRSSTTDQEQVLLLWRALEQAQTRSADETVVSLAAPLARILRGEQAARAFLLARGEWPEQETRQPDLLAPPSGFVVAENARDEWRNSAIRETLSRRYPRPLVEALPPRASYVSLALATMLGRYEAAFDPQGGHYRILTPGEAARLVTPAPSEPQIQTARAELRFLSEREEQLSRTFMEGATEAEVMDSLRPLARRLFLSERFPKVVSERLAHVSRDAAPDRKEAAERAEDRETHLAQEREEVLVLEALRYLRLSAEQLTQLSTLAVATEETFARQRAASVPALLQLEQFAAGGREWLLTGRGLPTEPQEQALALDRTLRDQRTRVEEEVVKARTADLAHLLTRSQAARAHLLARGLWPRDEATSVLLLDPASGFVLDEGARPDWKRAALKSALARHFPEEVVNAAMEREDPARAPRPVWLTNSAVPLIDPYGNLSEGRNASAAWVLFSSIPRSGAGEGEGGAALPPELRPLQDAAQRDWDALEARWADLRRLLRDGVTAEETAVVLRPLARRLFFSPRLEPVLREQLQRDR